MFLLTLILCFAKVPSLPISLLKMLFSVVVFIFNFVSFYLKCFHLPTYTSLFHNIHSVTRALVILNTVIEVLCVIIPTSVLSDFSLHISIEFYFAFLCFVENLLLKTRVIFSLVWVYFVNIDRTWSMFTS